MAQQENNSQLYAEVLLPLPLKSGFTYSVPPAMSSALKIGSRVIVGFGKKKFYTGIVSNLSTVAPPSSVEVKPIEKILDDYSIIRRPQLQFWQWVADYYFCSPGEVMKAALPGGLKIESESFVSPVEDFEESPDMPLSERELIILATLNSADRKMTVDDLGRLTGFTSINALVSKLVDKGAVAVAEKLVERYHSRKISFVKLAADPEGDMAAAVANAFAAVKGAPKQETALLALVEMSGLNRRDSSPREVTRQELLQRTGLLPSVLAAMQKKGVIEIYRKEVSRFDFEGLVEHSLPVLSEAQGKALREIHESWQEKDVTLLHGVTSSGKTEIYIHLIDYVMSMGRQALYLVPEIALTTQLTRRLQRVFGNKVIIYHSKFSDNERVELWRKLLHSSEPCVVIGARSSLFLPFADLGLVIVDEEHDSSYKQQDPAPRYNARDAAMVLARMHGGKTLLGSATPAVDTYYKATEGEKFGLVTLSERYAGATLPPIELVDLTRARLKGELKGAFATRTLESAHRSVAAGKQVIFFLNRRGYAPVAVCRQCAWTPKCENCDVALTYHRHDDALVCHYCGAHYPLPSVCPACKSPAVEVAGYGTERVEDEIEQNFPDSRIARMDLDSTRNKDALQSIVDEFSKGEKQILIGTQMVTKGLDFANVSMVTVVNADAVLSQPDYRANERGFNMLEQVAGRAGRRPGSDTSPEVVVQTRRPDHPVFPFLLAHDYAGFYNMELDQRRQYIYPPFVRLVYIFVKHRDPRHADDYASAFARELRNILGNRVFGPEEPWVARVKQLYIRKLMLKIEPSIRMSKIREALEAIALKLRVSGRASAKGVMISYDVDPL